MNKIVCWINRLRYRFLIWKLDRALMKQKKEIGRALLPAMKELLKQIESRENGYRMDIDTTPIETEYVEYNCIQPHEFTCPSCKGRFYSDVPQITIICVTCGAELIRKDFAKVNVFTNGKRVTDNV